METTGSNRSAIIVGSIFAVLQAVLYSTMGIFGKVLYATGLSAEQVIILRYACATVLLGGFLLVWRKQALVSKQPSVYVQVLFAFISSVSYFLAVERMSAGMTTVVFYTYPAVVAVCSTVLFKERFTLSTFVSLVLAMGGLLMVSGVMTGQITLDSLGLVLAIVSCLAFVVYTLLINKTARVEGPMTVTFTLSWTSFLGSCVIFAPSVPSLLALTLEQLLICCGLALACTILPIPLYIEAVKRIGGTKSSLLGISETPSSLLLAYLVLGETLTVDQAIGSILIILSIACVTAAPLLSQMRGKAEPRQAES